MIEVLAQGPLFLLCLAILLGVVVIIHELGHYHAGRWAGAAIESYSVGFFKPVIERTDKNGTRWRVNWLPFGGFVSFVNNQDSLDALARQGRKLAGRPYDSLAPWQRIIVSLAGPVANFILAVLLFAFVLGAKGSVQYDVYAADVTPGAPAAIGGMQPGDVISAIDGKPVASEMDIIALTSMSSGKALEFTILRDGKRIDLIIVPERRVRENALGQMVPQGTLDIRLGIVQDSVRMQRHGAVSALIGGSEETLTTLKRTVYMLGRIVRGQEPLALMSGPVAVGDAGRRIVNRTFEGEGALLLKVEALFWRAILLCAAVSVGIGFFNLLPLPILDGGHVIFNLYEMLRGRPLPEKFQDVALMAGMGLLLTLFVFITWGDILETGLFN